MLVKTEFVVNIYPKEFNDFFTLYFSIRDFKYYIFSKVLSPAAMAWNLPGFACIQLLWNQLIRI